MTKTVGDMMFGMLQHQFVEGAARSIRQRKPEPTELEKQRTRWLRWLGQVCRADRQGWAALLSANYIGWVARVMKDEYKAMPFTTPKEEVHLAFATAIKRADEKDLRALDMLYAENLFETRTGHR